MHNVLECFDKEELLKWRHVNKRLGLDVVPKCFKDLVYECPDEDNDTEYTFYKSVKSAKKLAIKNINGSAEHLAKIKELA
jgi:hypothetical protein